MPGLAWETMPEMAAAETGQSPRGYAPRLTASQSSANAKSNGSSLLASPDPAPPKPRAALAAGRVPPEPGEVDSLCARALLDKRIDEKQIADAVRAVDTQRQRSKLGASTGCVMCGTSKAPGDHPMPFCGHTMLCAACGPKLLAKAKRKGHGEAYSRAMCRHWPCVPTTTPLP